MKGKTGKKNQCKENIKKKESTRLTRVPLYEVGITSHKKK